SEAMIGGTIPGAGNVISGNRMDGVNITTTSSVGIIGNFIGTDIRGVAALGNGGKGGFIGGGGSDGAGGGGAAGAGHVVDFNGASGVQVGRGMVDQGAVGNAIRGNSIYANAHLGIDLGGDGVTPNDASDADTGPNDLLNYPRLALVEKGATTHVVGDVRGV